MTVKNSDLLKEEKAGRKSAEDENAKDKYKVEASSANDLDGCAAAEYTGLIPSLPRSSSQLEAYQEVLPYSPECFVQKKKDSKEK